MAVFENIPNELIDKALAGSKEAEDKLFKLLLERFRAFAAHWLGDMRANEIAHEACLTILKKYKSEKFEKGFLPWARGVHRMTLKHYLSKGNMDESKFTAFNEEIDMRLTADLNPIWKRDFLLCLREICRTNIIYARILLLYLNCRQTKEEMRKKLKLKSNGNFDIVLFRARKKLETCLKIKGAMA
jgi:hypothetical protein